MILKRKREEIVAGREIRGNRPAAQQRCVEDGFASNDAACRNFSLLQPKAILRRALKGR